MKVFINIKSLGSKKALEPAEYEIPDNITTLKEFIIALVRIEVERYNEKDREKKADLKNAIANAIKSFEDGLVRVYQKEEELENLEQKMLIQEGDTFTLIRLTFLAGRLW